MTTECGLNGCRTRLRDEEAWEQHKKKQHTPEKEFRRTFNRVIDDAAKVYVKHLPVKGESWKNVEINLLLGKFYEEVKELRRATHKIDTYLELLDILNMTLMLLERYFWLVTPSQYITTNKNEIRSRTP